MPTEQQTLAPPARTARTHPVEALFSHGRLVRPRDGSSYHRGR
ncbi:hypothetical protein ACIBQ3_11110 [Streptomyces rubiginosohelvolus]